jgi:dihydroorotase-like cyclic amidohydrolase
MLLGNFKAQSDLFSPKKGIADKYIPTYVFRNATIHASSTETIENGTLIIKGDKIIDIGKELKIPSSSLIFNLKGKHIYHSFIELNSDFGINKTTKKKMVI